MADFPEEGNEIFDQALDAIVELALVEFALGNIGLEELSESILSQDERGYYYDLPRGKQRQFVRGVLDELESVLEQSAFFTGSDGTNLMLVGIFAVIHRKGVLGSLHLPTQTRLGKFDAWFDASFWWGSTLSILSRDIMRIRNITSYQRRRNIASDSAESQGQLMFSHEVEEFELIVLVLVLIVHAVVSSMKSLHLPQAVLIDFLLQVSDELGFIEVDWDIAMQPSIEFRLRCLKFLSMRMLNHHQILGHGRLKSHNSLSENDALDNDKRSLYQASEIGFSPLLEVVYAVLLNERQLEEVPITSLKQPRRHYDESDINTVSDGVCLCCNLSTISSTVASSQRSQSTWKVLGNFNPDEAAADIISSMPKLYCERCFRITLGNPLQIADCDIEDVGYCVLPSVSVDLHHVNTSFASIWRDSDEGGYDAFEINDSGNRPKTSLSDKARIIASRLESLLKDFESPAEETKMDRQPSDATKGLAGELLHTSVNLMVLGDGAVIYKLTPGYTAGSSASPKKSGTGSLRDSAGRAGAGAGAGTGAGQGIHKQPCLFYVDSSCPLKGKAGSASKEEGSTIGITKVNTNSGLQQDGNDTTNVRLCWVEIPSEYLTITDRGTPHKLDKNTCDKVVSSAPAQSSSELKWKLKPQSVDMNNIVGIRKGQGMWEGCLRIQCREKVSFILRPADMNYHENLMESLIGLVSKYRGR